MLSSVRNEGVLTPSRSQFLKAANTQLCSMSLEFSRGNQDWQAVLHKADFGCIELIRYSGRGLQTWERLRAHIEADPREDFFFVMLQQGEYGIKAASTESKSFPNSFVVFSLGDTFHTYIRDLPPDGRFSALCARVPAASLRHRVPLIEDLFGRFNPVAPGIARAMRSNIQIALDEGEYLTEMERDVLAASITDLLSGFAKLAISGNERGSRHFSSAQEMLRRAKLFIDGNLAYQSLTPKDVAEHCRVSTRYLNMIFSEACLPVASYIRELRLQRCYEALRNEDLRHLSVIEVANQWGFNSSSHFSQIYKARFGKPPSFERLKSK